MEEDNKGEVRKETMALICESLRKRDGKARTKEIMEDIDRIVKERQIIKAMRKLDFVNSKREGMYSYWICDPKDLVTYVTISDEFQGLTNDKEWTEQKRAYMERYEK